MHYEKGDCSFAGVFLWCLRECLDLPPCATRKGTVVLWDGFYSPPCTTRKRTVVLWECFFVIFARMFWLTSMHYEKEDCSFAGGCGRQEGGGAGQRRVDTVTRTQVLEITEMLQLLINACIENIIWRQEKNGNQTSISHKNYFEACIENIIRRAGNQKFISLKKIYVKVYRNKRSTLIKVLKKSYSRVKK